MVLHIFIRNLLLSTSHQHHLA